MFLCRLRSREAAKPWMTFPPPGDVSLRGCNILSFPSLFTATDVPFFPELCGGLPVISRNTFTATLSFCHNSCIFNLQICRCWNSLKVPWTDEPFYFKPCTEHLLLFCTMTNKCTIISQIITLLHWDSNDYNIRICIKPMWNILVVNCISNSCIWNTCVTWKGIGYKLPEDDTIVSNRVGVW